MENTTEHTVFAPKEWKRRVLYQLFRKKGFRKRFFRSDFFFEQVMRESPLKVVSLDSLIGEKPEIVLEDFLSRNGNVSPYELLVIATLVAERKPQLILEVGTFDGNTTLQMALNAPEGAKIDTLDLPPGQTGTKEPVLKSDLQFIQDEAKQVRKFGESRVGHKVKQHLCDSTQVDFAQFAKERSLDFVFIDGGHSYECVKSDTENALPHLSENGCILWHDFTPLFGGVYQYLCELSKKVPLVHIAGTNLVFHDRGQ